VTFPTFIARLLTIFIGPPQVEMVGGPRDGATVLPVNPLKINQAWPVPSQYGTAMYRFDGHKLLYCGTMSLWRNPT